MIVLGVLAAGAVGACTRFAIERAVQPGGPVGLPWAAYVINPLGSFALGVVTGAALAGDLPGSARRVLGVGLVGAFTTVGPWTFDSLRLLLEGRRRLALTNAVAGFVVPVSAASLGLAMTGAL